MPVLDFKMVYRDGASVTAPVVSFKLVDNVSELTGIGIEGDLAYAKNTDLLYVHNGTTWMTVGVPFNGGIITNDLTIQKNNANAFLVASYGPTYPKARLQSWLNGSSLSFNIGNNAVKDDNTQGGTAFQPKADSFDFYHNVTGTWNLRASIDQYGIHSTGRVSAKFGVYTYDRVIPDGTWIDVPYNSAIVFANDGSQAISTPGGYIYTYCLQGNTCIMSFYANVMSTVSGVNPGHINVRLPTLNGVQLVNGNRTIHGTALVHDNGWSIGGVQIPSGWDALRVTSRAYPGLGGWQSNNNLYMGFEISFGLA